MFLIVSIRRIHTVIIWESRTEQSLISLLHVYIRQTPETSQLFD